MPLPLFKDPVCSTSEACVGTDANVGDETSRSLVESIADDDEYQDNLMGENKVTEDRKDNDIEVRYFLVYLIGK